MLDVGELEVPLIDTPVLCSTRYSGTASVGGVVPVCDSSLTGEGGLDLIAEGPAEGTVSRTFSSERSGTISGGSADLLGRRPARDLE